MKHKNFRNTAITALILAFILQGTGCKKFLDVVPDNVVTIDNAFTLKREAEKYLFTCYSYLPIENSPTGSLGFVAGDECWLPAQGRLFNNTVWDIALGYQNKVNPISNYWDGSMYAAIRDCNTFLANAGDLNKVSDVDLDTRQRWLGEAEFLKGYYHYLLLRNYGPIAIVDVNLPISATPDEVRVSRMPVDSVVNYISTLFDKAALKLPAKIDNEAQEMGRVTRPIVLAIKAKLLLMAASPLYNGNGDMSGLKNKDGKTLFTSAYDNAKWVKAADAAKAAIDAAEAAGFKLYKFDGLNKMTDTTRTQMSIRNAVCEKWNSEEIWASTRNVNLNGTYDYLQSICMGQIDTRTPINLAGYDQLCAPMKMAQLFYSDHGVPISEDKTYSFSDVTKLRTGTKPERFNIIEGYETSRLNFDREPRFYADLGFDGSIWYMQNSLTNSDSATWNVKARKGQIMNEVNSDQINLTGYWIKKLVNWKFSFVVGAANSATTETYPWPMVRLADVYLMYAEALNEASGPSADVYKYLDMVRSRAGLKGVQESWAAYSNMPAKASTKDGLRSIVHQERSIELAFEGNRIWDLRRWKEAAIELNKPITGWDRTQATANDYYRVVNYYNQKFISPRDYFWPIREYSLSVNPNLVQNLGW